MVTHGPPKQCQLAGTVSGTSCASSLQTSAVGPPHIASNRQCHSEGSREQTRGHSFHDPDERGNRSLPAEHISGASKTHADWLSRTLIDLVEWQFYPHLFHQIVTWFGLPQIDLFASPKNAQVPRFFTRFWTPGAAGPAICISSDASDPSGHSEGLGGGSDDYPDCPILAPLELRHSKILIFEYLKSCHRERGSCIEQGFD